MRLSLSLLAFIPLAFALPARVTADAEVAKPAPDFTLNDTTGKTHKLSALRGKYVVLEWTNYDCPFVKKHYGSGNMQALQKTWTGKGVVWLSINSSAAGKQGNYPAARWQEMMKEKNSAATALLLDGDGKVGQLYGARTTPHIFIIDPAGKLIYAGAADDTPSTDLADIPKAKNYINAALEESMAGKPVTVPFTKSYGCGVKY
jgi:peroxiredoxin